MWQVKKNKSLSTAIRNIMSIQCYGRNSIHVFAVYGCLSRRTRTTVTTTSLEQLLLLKGDRKVKTALVDHLYELWLQKTSENEKQWRIFP